MIILVVMNCTPALRGDLTKWLIEINSGVYVGKVSARVREELWQRVCEHIRDGQATMVYPAENEQGLAFRVWNTTWEPVDFDGITLMLHPSQEHLKQKESPVLESGFSDAAKFDKIRRIQKARVRKGLPETYCVLDLETTGLDVGKDRIIEIGALKCSGAQFAEFQKLIIPDVQLPSAITTLTGITPEMLQAQGCSEKEALSALLSFLENNPVVCHNAVFDINFLQKALRRWKLPPLKNKVIDTLPMARNRLDGLKSHQLSAIAEHLKIEYSGIHRALDDCRTTNQVYNKLNEIA